MGLMDRCRITFKAELVHIEIECLPHFYTHQTSSKISLAIPVTFVEIPVVSADSSLNVGKLGGGVDSRRCVWCWYLSRDTPHFGYQLRGAWWPSSGDRACWGVHIQTPLISILVLRVWSEPIARRRSKRSGSNSRVHNLIRLWQSATLILKMWSEQH